MVRVGAVVGVRARVPAPGGGGAAVGTTAVICVSPHWVTVAGSPLKVMVLVLCTDPKPVPLIVTVELTGPEDGDNPVIVGAPSTVRFTPLLVTPKRVTVTSLLTAPAGTTKESVVAVQTDALLAIPPTLTVT